MKLLFICTHNACRSILAEAITRKIAGDRIEVASAGSAPAGRIHPLTERFLKARGYPTEDLHSKGFDELGAFRPDVVITVCDSAARESCPVWLSRDVATAHWGLPDPSHLAGSDADRERAFDDVAQKLTARIQALLEQPFEGMDNAQLGSVLEALHERCR